MDEKCRQRLLEKNQKLIDMVIQRAKRDFPEDIAIIGLTGSFSTGDYHEKSDLDLIIINNTQRGWDIATCFILEDVGYDIYCTPWETRIEAQSKLESNMVSCLVDLEVLYVAKPEYLERLKVYQQKALELLAEPIGKNSLARAKKYIDSAKQAYGEAMLFEEAGEVRYAAGRVAYELINAVIALNNTYIKRGIKRYMEEIHSCKYVPERFEERYMTLVEALTVEEMREAASTLLKSVLAHYAKIDREFVDKPVPTYENLCGTYEELWCNCRNKVLVSVASGDKAFVFQAALGAQNYLDEMTEMFGTKKFDLMKAYHPQDLEGFQEAFLGIMDEYLEHYRRVGRKVERYDTFEEVYKAFMK